MKLIGYIILCSLAGCQPVGAPISTPATIIDYPPPDANQTRKPPQHHASHHEVDDALDRLIKRLQDLQDVSVH